MTTPRFTERLTDELGVPTWRTATDSSPRSHVWLAELRGTPVVVKEIVGSTAAFEREATALRLAGRVDPPVTPALLGADDGILVLELLTQRPIPADWPIHYADGLRRLHSATSADDDGVLPRWTPPTERDVGAFLALARRFDVPVPPAVESELDDLLHRLAPTGFALLHGDPCPGNDIYTDDGIRFVDLEQASLGDGATDLAYLRIGLPTCWCSLALDPDVITAAERAYGATDVADACAGWLLRGDALVQKSQRDNIDQLARMSTTDWTWGTATARERFVHRLGVVAADSDRFVAFGRLAATLRTTLLDVWRDVRPLLTIRPDTWPRSGRKGSPSPGR